MGVKQARERVFAHGWGIDAFLSLPPLFLFLLFCRPLAFFFENLKEQRHSRLEPPLTLRLALPLGGAVMWRFLGIFNKISPSSVVKLHQNLTFGDFIDLIVGGAVRRPQNGWQKAIKSYSGGHL